MINITEWRTNKASWNQCGEHEISVLIDALDAAYVKINQLEKAVVFERKNTPDFTQAFRQIRKHEVEPLQAQAKLSLEVLRETQEALVASDAHVMELEEESRLARLPRP